MSSYFKNSFNCEFHFFANRLVCSRLSAGVTLIVDITSDLVAPNIVQLIRSSNIPYVHVDITIRPFVRAFFKFVEYNKVNDVGLIFSNEEGKKII